MPGGSSYLAHYENRCGAVREPSIAMEAKHMDVTSRLARTWQVRTGLRNLVKEIEWARNMKMAWVLQGKFIPLGVSDDKEV